MSSHPDLASIAALLSEPTRVAMLDALMGGLALPASELARRAHVTASTASEHLSKLVAGGLICLERVGRNHYYRLANPEVARAFEALALIAPPAQTHSLSASLAKRDLCAGRTCYDHLAGQLGVAVAQALVERGYIEEQPYQYAVLPAGEPWLHRIGIDLTAGAHTKRKFAPKCMDWTERWPHIGGWLGAGLVTQLFAHKWLRRCEGSRAVKLTEAGQRLLQQQLGVSLKGS